MTEQQDGLIGLLGGTFNPVHNGHLFLALEAAHHCSLERVVLLPNCLPPHKEAPSVTGEDRFKMLEAATAEVSNLTVSRRELERKGRSYTIDTLESFPSSSRLVFCCGADAFEADWYRLEDVVDRLERLLIANRAGTDFQLPRQLESLSEERLAKVEMMPFPDITISSSDIRTRIIEGRPFRFLIPDPVYRIITKSGFYREKA